MAARTCAFTRRSSRDVEAVYRWYETERPGLGAEFREELWRLLWRIQTENGTTVVATTTDARLALPLTDQVFRLPDSRRLTFTVIPVTG